MREHRARPACQDPRYESPMGRQSRMSHREHSLMDSVQSPRRRSAVYEMSAESERRQLPKRDHPMLLRCKFRNCPVTPPSPPSTGRFPVI